MTEPRHGAGSFTERVRQELAGTPVEGDGQGELGVLLRLAGRFHRVGGHHGSRTRLEVEAPSGAVVRRMFRLLPAGTVPRPQLYVRQPAGVRTAATYGAVLEDVDVLARRLGLLDADARPVAGLPPAPAAVAVRAGLLTVASASDPGRGVHLEFRLPADAAASDLRTALERLGVRPHHDAQRERLVVKAGPAVASLLEAAGAPVAAAEFDEHVRRRRLRNDATRLANADAANVARTIEAAQAQLDLVERAVAAVGWHGLADELRVVALARLVNPTASLTELGELCDPPVGKSAVSRRLARIAALANGPTS